MRKKMIAVIDSRAAHTLHQGGRTLIELLVAIGLGLLILLGVGSLFLGANQSTRVSSNIASTEETGQVVLATIGRAVQRAGYSEVLGANDGSPPRSALLYSGLHVQGCAGANFVVDAATNNPVVDDQGFLTCNPAPPPGSPDSLMVAFQADNVLAPSQAPTTDCLGQAAPFVQIPNPDYRSAVLGPPAGQMPFVRNIYELVGGNLRCRGISNPAVPQALIGNVEDFKVYFGFDDAAYANPVAAAFANDAVARSVRTATYINNLAAPSVGYNPWDFVVTVQLCVLVASAEAGVTSQTGANIVAQYLPCPQNENEAAGLAAIQPVPNPADGRVRRAFNQVFAMRSRTTPAPLNLP